MKKKEDKPFHVAIIMDGNGRWAQRRHLPRKFGHRKGMETVEKIVTHSKNTGIDILSIFAFSTENWKRPEREIEFLFSSFGKYLSRKKKVFLKEDIRLNVMGRREGLPRDLLSKIDDVAKVTENNKSLFLNVAFNYGGRAEMVDAAKKIAEDVERGLLKIGHITEEVFKKYLYPPLLNDVDLLIRTSGEKRISNFFLWGAAYAEIYFTDILWPDFSVADLDKAIDEYRRRERRFGGI